MKKVFALVTLLVAAAAVSFAQDTIAVDVSDMDTDDQLAFMFFYGYEAILEECCKGAFLAFDPDWNYIGGWRTDQTPEGFCTDVPTGTIATMQILPIGIAKTMFLLLEDRETVAKMVGLDCDGVYVCCLFLPEDDMVVEAPAYNYGRRLLDDEIVRHGLEPSEFYAFMEGEGVTLDGMVYAMYGDTATASEIVLDGMGRMESKRAKAPLLSSLKDPMALVCLGSLAVLVVLVVLLMVYNVIVGRKLARADAQAERDEHNRQVED